MPKYTIGIDFGTLSGRAVLVDTADGREVASATLAYPHAVMDKFLKDQDTPLPPDFALQDPADYLAVLETVLPAVLKESGAAPEEIAGLGVDFTCATVLPVKADGTPLCFLSRFANDPHAYVKLWKHHATQKYADRINALAAERGEKWVSRYSGGISPEWMFPKIAETVDLSPDVYDAADYFIEAGDWIDWMLTGVQTRSYPFAAYKSIYDEKDGYPAEDFFAALDPRMRTVVKDKLDAPIIPIGAIAGKVTKEASARFGIPAGIPVVAALPDGHSAAPALDIKEDGDLFALLGTSGCFLAISERAWDIPGICGRVKDGIIPGMYGYSAGLCCLGDHFAYAANNLTSPAYVKEADSRGISMLKLLIEKAAKKAPGESGVIALNWFNGNRNILTDAELSGLFVGMTLATAPEDLMRALLEATAFGMRNILENYERHGLLIRRVVASGGIAQKDPFTMQLYADILNRPLLIAGTTQGPAAAMAIYAAVGAGIYPDLKAAGAAMCHLSEKVYYPNDENRAVYDSLYAAYLRLHDHFGRGGDLVMHDLRRISREVKAAKSQKDETEGDA